MFWSRAGDDDRGGGGYDGRHLGVLPCWCGVSEDACIGRGVVVVV